MTTQGKSASGIDSNFAVLGGLKRDGGWRVGGGVKHTALVGGISLDMSEAEFDSEDVTITKIALVGGADLTFPEGVTVQVNAYSLVGGVSLSVPANTRVVLSGFTLLGGRSEKGLPDVAGESSGVIRVKRYSFLGGISITRY
jgi:hypothetical protein